MKTTFTSHEIAHIWAHKSAPYGKSPGAVSFDGPVIRSYATAIARHIEHKGKPAIIYNATSYSVSTSKHQGRIRQAIHGLDIPVFRVDGQGYNESLLFTGDQLFTHYVEQAAKQEAQALLPRIRQTTRDSHKAQASTFLENAKAVAAFFGLRKKVDEKAISRLAAAKARESKRIAEEAEKRNAAWRERDAKEAAERLEKYELWKQGADVRNDFHSLPVAFRVETRRSLDGENREVQELVSTLGARVPLRAAQVAYRFAMSKRGQDWRENGETCPVGHYRLNAINEHGIVAGCHRITWAELERLAPVLSGETVNA